MEAEEPDEFKRKGSEEARDIIMAGITKDDILEIEMAVEYACRCIIPNIYLRPFFF